MKEDQSFLTGLVHTASEGDRKVECLEGASQAWFMLKAEISVLYVSCLKEALSV